MKNRHIPDGYLAYTPDGVNHGTLVSCFFNKDRMTAMMFIGKQSKSTWHFKFPSIEALDKKFHETWNRVENWELMKVERKEQRKKEVLEVKVGDLFVSSWGWEQTNVDFYQCVATKGKRTFVIREIASKMSNRATGNGMACFKIPVKDAFLDPEKYPPLTKSSLKLNSYSSLSKTTEESEHYCSWYA